MMEQVTLYELYLQIDADGDGETETVQVFFSGFGNVGTLLEWEVWEDEPVYSNVPCTPVRIAGTPTASSPAPATCRRSRPC